MDMTRFRPLLVNAAVAVVSLLLAALAAEVALRVVLNRGLNPFEPDDEIGFRLRPDFDGVYPRVRVRTDSHGHRIPESQEADDTGRFLFMGDSVTFAFSVPAATGFPVRVATALGVPEDATNTAVPGYNLQQATIAAREQVARRRPEWILYGLVVNDLSASMRPGRYSDIDPHAARAGGWLSSSYLVSFIQRRVARIQWRFDLEEPADEAAAADSPNRRDPRNLPAERLDAFDSQWRALEQLQSELDVPLFVLVSPHRQQVEETGDDSFQTFVGERCDGSNLVCLDPLAMLREHSAEGLFTGGSSYHFSERGHELLAEFLMGPLREATVGTR